MKPREDMAAIYRAALEVFSTYGYAKTTVEDVAKKLSMTKGNLYRYSRGKRELYEKTAAWALMGWQQKVARDMEAEPDPARKFLVMCKSAVLYLSEDEPLRRLLTLDPDIFPMFPENDPFESINENSVAMIRLVLEEGIRKGAFREVDVSAAADAIFSIYKMLVIRAYLKTDEEALWSTYETVMELLTKGLFSESEPSGQKRRRPWRKK